MSYIVFGDISGVFQEAVAKGVRNISFGDLSGKLGVTMYEILAFLVLFFSRTICNKDERIKAFASNLTSYQTCIGISFIYW